LVYDIVGFKVKEVTGGGDNREFQLVLHPHEEITKANNNSLLVISSKISNLE
jgi:hypothetical protein